MKDQVRGKAEEIGQGHRRPPHSDEGQGEASRGKPQAHRPRRQTGHTLRSPSWRPGAPTGRSVKGRVQVPTSVFRIVSPHATKQGRWLNRVSSRSHSTASKLPPETTLGRRRRCGVGPTDEV